ncbi:DsbA family protein, partial [Candidatus Micrarchaeota archaeon]|nr:DsbA family protein [Candidatus Micrarchaeota archaeon]
LACVNPDYSNVTDIWEGCASSNGIDVQKIKNCSESVEAENILKEHIRKGDVLGVTGSPTFYFNGERYSGNRTANAFTRAICESAPESKVCGELPPEVEVNLFVVNDLECELCDASSIIAQVKAIFPKLKVEEIDFSSEEGQTHIKNFGVESVPFFFFDETVEKHENYATIERYLVKKNKYFELKVSGIKFTEREEVANHVDLFVMSQCPYGTMAEAALIEITEAIPDLTYSIHFIATDTPEGFVSLHGEPEVAEDTRQVCVMKYNEDKLLDYLECLNEDYGNAGTVWKGCATNAGIDVSKIEACSTTEVGENLLKENIILSNEIEVNASPTFLLNNTITFGGIYAEQIKQNICSVNELDGCEKTLSGPTSTPSTGGDPSC